MVLLPVCRTPIYVDVVSVDGICITIRSVIIGVGKSIGHSKLQSMLQSVLRTHLKAIVLRTGVIQTYHSLAEARVDSVRRWQVRWCVGLSACGRKQCR